MTLRVFPDVVQGSDEWHEQRRGMVTASVVGRLITPSTVKVASNVESRALTALLASERITGWTELTGMSDDMLRGWDDEPRALEHYSKLHAPVDQVGFMVRDDWGFQIGYSPDGVVGEDGLVEVKSRVPKIHLGLILNNRVPNENMAQLQCGLLVSGRKWIDYLSYCGGMPMWPIRVTPDPVWQAAIVEAVTALEAAVEQMTAAYRSAVDGLPTTERVIEQEMVI